MELGKEGLREIAGNIVNAVRQFNLREGMGRADERLPKRFFEESLEDSGKVLDEADFDRMLSDYYAARGWTAPGQ
jgi:aldehyde:ferredoxin oxidoreductase